MCCNSMAIAHVIFEVNQTKIKGGCQSGRKVVTHNSKSDLPLGKIFLKAIVSEFPVNLK